MACLTDKSDDLIDGCVLHGEVWGWNDAVNARNVCAVGGRQVDDLFFPEYFLVAMPMGLMRKGENGGSLNGPIMNPS